VPGKLYDHLLGIHSIRGLWVDRDDLTIAKIGFTWPDTKKWYLYLNKEIFCSMYPLKNIIQRSLHADHRIQMQKLRPSL